MGNLLLAGFFFFAFLWKDDNSGSEFIISRMRDETTISFSGKGLRDMGNLNWHKRNWILSLDGSFLKEICISIIYSFRRILMESMGRFEGESLKGWSRSFKSFFPLILMQIFFKRWSFVQKFHYDFKGNIH